MSIRTFFILAATAILFTGCAGTEGPEAEGIQSPSAGTGPDGLFEEQNRAIRQLGY